MNTEYQVGDIFERGRERVIIAGVSRIGHNGSVWFYTAECVTRSWWSKAWPVKYSERISLYPHLLSLMFADGWRHIAGPTFKNQNSITLTWSSGETYTLRKQVKVLREAGACVCDSWGAAPDSPDPHSVAIRQMKQALAATDAAGVEVKL